MADDYDYRNLTIYEASGEVTIDGLEDEAVWAAPEVAENAIDRILHDWNVDPVVNTWGYAASFKAVYDNYNLYLFIKVTDNAYVPYDAQMTGETNIDNVELFFFPDPAGQDEFNGVDVPDARGRGLSQLRASVGNGDNRATGGGLAMGFAVDAQITGYQYKTVPTATGYNLEIAVPWDVVVPDEFVDNLETGGTILFDINPANCVDYATGRVIILGWSTDDYHSWKANFKLGKLTFGGTYSGIISPKTVDFKYTFKDNLLQLVDVNNANVSVYDVSGCTVKKLAYTGQSINLENLVQGVYIVSVQGVGNFKIVK
jgi:hypothetical protein